MEIKQKYDNLTRQKMIEDFEKRASYLSKEEGHLYARLVMEQHEYSEQQRIDNPQTEEDKAFSEFMKAQPKVSVTKLFKETFGDDLAVMKIVEEVSKETPQDLSHFARLRNTEDFVHFVNISSFNEDVSVLTHLAYSLGRGWIRNPDHTSIQNLKDIKTFFKFKNPRYLKFAKNFFKAYLINEFLRNYKSATLAISHVGDGVFTGYFDIVEKQQFASDLFYFMVKNPQMFDKQDVADYVNAFAKTLLLRNKHPSTLYKPYFKIDPNRPNMSYYQRPRTYHHTNGIYPQERDLFLDIKKYFEKNNLPYLEIEKVLAQPTEKIDYYSKYSRYDLERKLEKNKDYRLPCNLEKPKDGLLSKLKKFVLVKEIEM